MPTPDGQLFCDEFIGDVIGIDLLREFRLRLPKEGHEQVVLAEVKLGRGDDVAAFHGRGKTMGFALAEIRERIREVYGR